MENNLRFVAHFDILGFKTLSHKDEDLAWGILSDFQYCVDRLQNDLSILLNDSDIPIGNRLKFVLFSDTILIFSLGNTKGDFIITIMGCAQLFAELLHKCVPIRGGISYGNFYFNSNKQLYLGLPFIKAYEIGESAQWLGIVLDNSVYEYYSKNQISKTWEAPIILWDVPQKNGSKRKLRVINWPAIFRRNFKIPFPLDIDDFYPAFKHLFGEFINLPERSRNKYVNTLDFINFSDNIPPDIPQSPS